MNSNQAVHIGTRSEKPPACIRFDQHYDPLVSLPFAHSSRVSWRLAGGNGRSIAGIYLLYVSVPLSRTRDSERRLYERYFVVRLANRILLRHF